MSKKNTVKSFEDLFEQLEDIVKKNGYWRY